MQCLSQEFHLILKLRILACLPAVAGFVHCIVEYHNVLINQTALSGVALSLEVIAAFGNLRLLKLPLALIL